MYTSYSSTILDTTIYLLKDDNGNIYAQADYSTEKAASLAKESLQGTPQRSLDIIEYQNKTWVRLQTSKGEIDSLALPLLGQVSETENSPPALTLLGDTLFDQLALGATQAEKLKGKKAVLLVGSTGSGKSAFIDHMLGLKLEKEGENIKLVATPAEGKFAPIGTGSSSTTRFPTLYTDEYLIDYCDLGGLFDRRGPIVELAVTHTLKQALENLIGAKVVLALEVALLTAENGHYFLKFLAKILHLLVGDKPNMNNNSILFMLTKPDKSPLLVKGGYVKYSHAAALSFLREQADELKETPDLQNLYKFLLRKEGQYILVCDPLENEQRAIRKLINEKMEFVAHPKALFSHFPFSPDLKETLKEEMRSLVKYGFKLYSDFLDAGHQQTLAKHEMAGAETKIKEIESCLALLQEADAAKLKEVTGNKREKIRELEQEKDRLKWEIREIEYQTKQQTVLEDGEYSTPYKEEECTKNINSSSFSSNKSLFSFDTALGESNEILSHTFYYEGPEPRVETSRGYGVWGKLQSLGNDKYSITYTAVKGASLEAKVKYYIKMKDDPIRLLKLRGLYQLREINETKLSQKREEIASLEKSIAAFEAKPTGQTETHRKLLTEQLSEAKAKQASFREKLKACEATQKKLEQQIKTSEKKLGYVERYLQYDPDLRGEIKEVEPFLEEQKKYINERAKSEPTK